MRRYDQRTPEQVALQRIDYLLGLSDHDLCAEKNPRCAWLTRTDQPGLCTYWEIGEGPEQPGIATTRPCRDIGEMWGIQIPGLPGVRRRCTHHAAEAIRARLWLQKHRIMRGKR